MYRIALFGAPGSGKTTVAKQLAKQLSINVIEASHEVIYPLASRNTLPNEQEALTFLAQNTTQTSNIQREKARALFTDIQTTFGADFIARALHTKFVDTGTKDAYIFSGLRGVENARYCRLHNDLVIYLHAEKQQLINRLLNDRGITETEAITELDDEEQRFHTSKIKQIANIVIDTSAHSIDETVESIIDAVTEWNRECRRCVNAARNPAIRFNTEGYCHICEAYMTNLDEMALQKELDFLDEFSQKDGYQVMVGISGGKDSTATLYQVMKRGLKPLAFTFDTGYLPSSTIPRARAVAKQLGVDFEVIDIRPYIQDIDRQAYNNLASLYELPFTLETKQRFREAYEEGRKHYSIKCPHAPTFVRSCQICRRMVVRAYHSEATKRGIQAIVLGMNEWTNLSATQKGGMNKVSGMRTLHPENESTPVHIFHLPFLMRRTIDDVKQDLNELGWQPPQEEELIESNSNSYLLARSTELMAKRLLEFHPDSTRLGREVTVGFISREQAKAALKKIHPFKFTPREVLQQAKILS